MDREREAEEIKVRGRFASDQWIKSEMDWPLVAPSKAG